MIPEIGRAEVADAVTLVRLLWTGHREDAVAFLAPYEDGEKTRLILALMFVAAACADRPVDIPLLQFLDKLPDLA